MSLNQKYTWHNFLREFPEHKEKGTKRTSPEGKKAFEAAYKAHAKKYLADRAEILDKVTKRAGDLRDQYVIKIREYTKGGKTAKINIARRKIARVDTYLSRLEKLKEQNKSLQKEFK